MAEQQPFKWRHFEAEIILVCVRWYLRYALSYRDLEELMRERGLSVDHTTISRWVQRYAPELEKRCRPHLRRTTDSWRVDETYVKVKGEWMYLSRAVDSQGNTLEFLLSATRDAQAAKRFFAKALHASHTVTPRVITVDKNAAYPKALKEMKAAGDLAASCELRQSKYLNNLVEQDHRFIKWLVKPGMGFFSFETAWNTLQGYESMNMRALGADARGGKREHHWTDFLHCQPVWTGCLGATRNETSRPSSSLVNLCNTDGKEVIRVSFFAVTCQACPVKELCTKREKHKGRILTLSPQRVHEERLRRRTEQDTLAFQQRYALRSGIEGSLSEGIRRHGLRRARYRGQSKTQLQATAIAAAINLVRIRQMLQRTQLGLSPRPKRPLSPFARLRSLLAA